jgi:hypothetical protein
VSSECDQSFGPVSYSVRPMLQELYICGPTGVRTFTVRVVSGTSQAQKPPSYGARIERFRWPESPRSKR